MTRNKYQIGTPALLFVLVLAAPLSVTWAQDLRSLQSPRSAAEIIGMFDTNGDGRVDQTELRFTSIKVFDEFDTNRDNVLSPAELPGLAPEGFAAADSDKDGKLSVFEYSQAEFLHFGVIDEDKDGFITSDEISAYQKRAR